MESLQKDNEYNHDFFWVIKKKKLTRVAEIDQ